VALLVQEVRAGQVVTQEARLVPICKAETAAQVYMVLAAAAEADLETALTLMVLVEVLLAEVKAIVLALELQEPQILVEVAVELAVLAQPHTQVALAVQA
jgi:hypothetical protein